MKPYIIVGAGILGCSTAYHLVKKGAPVLLIDQHDQGEATRSAAGIISPWLSQKNNPKLYEMINKGAHYYPSIIKELENDGITNTSYKKVGSLHLHKSDHKLDKMIDDLEDRKTNATGIEDISKLSGEEVKSNFPMLSNRMGAIHVSGGARVNGDWMKKALKEGAKQHGAEVIHGEAELVNETTIRVGRQTFDAETLIVTNGAWADRFLKHIGVKLDVTSQKTQILQLEMIYDDPSNWPAIMLPNNKYIVGFENNKVFIGSAHEENHDFDSTSSAVGVYEILKTAFKFAPGLEDAKFIESRIGFRPMLPNKTPYIGYLPGYSKIMIANGLGASGITSGPFIGSEVANIVLNETHA